MLSPLSIRATVNKGNWSDTRVGHIRSGRGTDLRRLLHFSSIYISHAQYCVLMSQDLVSVASSTGTSAKGKTGPEASPE